jgi:hypoxanthine phosphoribosyltransferase
MRDEFFPDYIVTLWPGGVNPGLCVHEVFKYLKDRGKVDRVPDHIAINAHHSYNDSTSPVIMGLEYLEERVEGSNVLLVDTTFRSGRLANAVAHRLKYLLRRNISQENIRVASVYFNHEHNATWNDFPVFKRPHYSVFESRANIIYPHSVHKLKDLGLVKERDQELYELLND